MVYSFSVAAYNTEESIVGGAAGLLQGNYGDVRDGTQRVTGGLESLIVACLRLPLFVNAANSVGGGIPLSKTWTRYNNWWAAMVDFLCLLFFW